MMRRCNAAPYEGEKPYIFVSYSHKDSGMVFPVIEYLARKGYRIWYDNGIHPGSDWLESIGEHLSRSEVFMSFISERSLASHNCKNEFNFASMENKKALTVILEPVQLSMALKMQMASIQGIIRYEYPGFDEYMSKFLQSEILDPCLGEPDDSIIVAGESAFTEQAEAPKAKSLFGWFTSDAGQPEKGGYNTGSKALQDTEAVKNDKTEDISEAPESDEDDEDENDGRTVLIDEGDDEKTMMFRMCYYLTRRSTGEKIEITHDDYTVGRKCKSGQADYMVEDNMKNVSRRHMTFHLDADRCLLKDNGTPNGTFLNQARLDADKEYSIHDGDEIVMGYSNFTFDVSTEMKKS